MKKHFPRLLKANLDPKYLKQLAWKINDDEFRPFLRRFMIEYKILRLQPWKKTFIFDSENYQQGRKQYPICMCGIKIDSKGKISTRIWMIRNIINMQRDSGIIIGWFKTFLRNHGIQKIGFHGGNQEEYDLVAPFEERTFNTAEYLRLLRKNGIIPKQCSNLLQFEKKIGYTRHACALFKHKKWKRHMWFQAMKQSLFNHIKQQPQRTCLCCQKPQDIIKYCCEDAFSAFLIFLLYKKHENEIEKNSDQVL